MTSHKFIIIDSLDILQQIKPIIDINKYTVPGNFIFQDNLLICKKGNNLCIINNKNEDSKFSIEKSLYVDIISNELINNDFINIKSKNFIVLKNIIQNKNINTSNNIHMFWYQGWDNTFEFVDKALEQWSALATELGFNLMLWDKKNN